MTEAPTQTVAKEIAIPARDGVELAGTLFLPDRPADGAPFVLVGAAMGVPRRFYHPFATYLADQGLPALSFDYRGIGGSAPDRLRGFEATLYDWAEQDVAGVLDWIETTQAPDRIVLAGHSVAGQLLGLVPGHHRVERMLTVTSVKGYWRLWPRRHRPKLLVLWYGLVPILTRTAGYFPARLAGLGGEDLPRGVAETWARWGKHPAYMVDSDGQPLHDGFAAYQGQVRAYSFTDDWYAPWEPSQALLDLFEQAETEHHHVDPADRGLDGIGHFGFYRPRIGHESGLWEEAVAWLTG